MYHNFGLGAGGMNARTTSSSEEPPATTVSAAEIPRWNPLFTEQQNPIFSHIQGHAQLQNMSDDWVQSISDFEETTFFNAPFLQNNAHENLAPTDQNYQSNQLTYNSPECIARPPSPFMLRASEARMSNTQDQLYQYPLQAMPEAEMAASSNFGMMGSFPDAASLPSQEIPVTNSMGQSIMGLNFNNPHPQESFVGLPWTQQEQGPPVALSRINPMPAQMVEAEQSPSPNTFFPNRFSSSPFQHGQSPSPQDVGTPTFFETRFSNPSPFHLQPEPNRGQGGVTGYRLPRTSLPDGRASRPVIPQAYSSPEEVPSRHTVQQVAESVVSPSSSQAETSSAQGQSVAQSSPQSAEGRAARDEYLIKGRRAGLTYREIKLQGGFTEAESTLRGRYRVLTKAKSQRLRTPIWTETDRNLLMDAVPLYGNQKTGKSHKVLWKDVSKYILDNGGSYEFGTATCKKKWESLMGILEGAGEEEQDEEDGEVEEED